MKKIGVVTAAVLVGLASAAHAADVNPPVATKAPPPAAAPAPPASCTNFWDFITTSCPLTWYGVTLYGTVDMGGTYQTHGTPFDKNFPTGASYLLGAGGGNATGRTAGFGLGPNAMSQSNVGVKIAEPIGGGVSFIAQGELAYDPYSLLLANAPQAMQNGIGQTQYQAALPYDSSRWGWLNTNQFVGFSSPVYGTLTFGRQNAVALDQINAYDPMGGAYAFSPIGYSGKAGGAGDTEDARWTTAIKYRVNIGNFRFGVMGQPLSNGYSMYNPNNGAVSGDIGTDFKGLGPGTLSLDVSGTWEKDAVNIGPSGWGTTASGWAIQNGSTAYLKATLSNNTSFMATAKYDMKPVVPITFYAGYEWIQFSNPSDPVTTSFRDDGFLFNYVGVNAPAPGPGGNGTSIANNAFNANCNGVGSANPCSNEIFQIMWTGFKYGITKDLDLVGAYYHYIQNQYVVNPVCAGISAAKSQCAGYFDVISGVIDWRFLPKWDAYIGTMYSAAFGGIANGDIARNNLATTAGVRFRF